MGWLLNSFTSEVGPLNMSLMINRRHHAIHKLTSKGNLVEFPILSLLASIVNKILAFKN